MTSMPTINIDDAQAACLRLNACIIDFVCLEVSKSNRFRQTPQLSTMARRCAPMVAKKLASFLMQDSTAGIAVMEEAINQSLLHMKQDGWLGTFGASLKSKHQSKKEIMYDIKAELEKRVEVVLQALDGVEDQDERHEILMEEQDVSIDKLTTDELEIIDLSIKQMAMLKPIIAFEDEKENEDVKQN